MLYVFRLSDLPKLDLQVDHGTDFEAWRAQWTSYATLSGLSGESEATKVQALTLCFSRETLTVVNNLGLTEEERANADTIITAIKRHVDGHINVSVERRRLRRRMQQPGESFDDIHSFIKRACNFCSAACTQKNIRDQIIEGLIDGDTIEHLLQQHNLTLDMTITMCRAQEAAKKQRKDIADHSVLAIRYPPKQPARQRPMHTSLPSPKPCQGCGLQPHQGGRAQCPAFKQTCRHCLKVGHFARVCHSRQPQQKRPAARAIVTTEEIDQEPVEYTTPTLTTISVKQVTIEPAPTITMQIITPDGSCRTQVLPDSGADISAAGEHILPHLNEHRDDLLPSEFTPRAANGQRINSIGKMCVQFQLAGKEHKEDVHIFPNLNRIIMSWKAAKALGILSQHYPLPPPTNDSLEPNIKVTTSTHTPPSMDDLKLEFPTVFDGSIRTMKGEEFHISLTAHAKPFCVHTPRSVPFIYRDKL